MDWNDLEDELIETIRRCCISDEDIANAKRYFNQVSVNQIIDQALEE